MICGVKEWSVTEMVRKWRVGLIGGRCQDGHCRNLPKIKEVNKLSKTAWYKILELANKKARYYKIANTAMIIDFLPFIYHMYMITIKDSS